MLIKQLSVFLENKQGRFWRIAKLLGEAGINMQAFTVSETNDFGLLRLIVSDPERAVKVLRDASYAVSENEVICIHCPDEPGALAKAMELLSNAGVFIEYMYAFAQGNAANVIIRPDDLKRCEQVLLDNKIKLLALSDLYNL